MKTIAAVLCALFATAGPAWAHGGAGGPVMGGAPPMSGLPVRAGFPTQVGFPIISRPEPDRTLTADRKRKERGAATIDYADLCKAAVYVPAIYQQFQVKGGPPCPVETQNGVVPLPPPFMW